MSSISINQLPRIEEVNTGDLFLIQTPSSSNTLDFKDLIIGLENTTFANTISTFNTNIEILSADVGNLSAKVDTNTDNIVIANDNISTNTANIATNTANLLLSAAVIDVNAANIATNTADITTLQTGVIDTTTTPTSIDGAFTGAKGVPITIAGVSYYIMLSAVPV